jgi:phosphatidylinositol glycan class B
MTLATAAEPGTQREPRPALRWLERLLLRHERRLVPFSLAMILITAWSSATFFQADEHWQVIEFMGLKMGTTTAAELPWEWSARIRPWFQPWLYYWLLRPLTASGVADPFVHTLVLRLVSGLFAFVALTRLLRLSEAWFTTEEARRWRLRWLTLAGFVPYLAVRTSSENLASSFFLFGLYELAHDLAPERRSERATTWGRWLRAGLLFGMAFQCRFQVAMMVAGVALWLLLIARIPLRNLVLLGLGFATLVAAGALIDRWGYGEWVFPAWNYLRVNLMEGKAAEFGTKWFGAYLHITLANIFAPVVILAHLGLFLCWWRRPRHLVTFVSAPFLLGHWAIGHKEERFMFPVLLLGLVGAALGYEQAATPQRGSAAPESAPMAVRIAGLFRAVRSSWVYRAASVWNGAGMLLLALYPLGWRPHFAYAEYVYRHFPGPVQFVYQDPLVKHDYPFYRRGQWTYLEAEALRQGELQLDPLVPTFWLRAEPFSELRPDEALGATPSFVFSEFVASQRPSVQALFPRLAALRQRLLSIGWDKKRIVWVSMYRIDPMRLACAPGCLRTLTAQRPTAPPQRMHD